MHCGIRSSFIAAAFFAVACSGGEGPTGPAGPAGSVGAAGGSCAAADNLDGTYTVTCGTDQFVLSDGQPGSDGITTAVLSGTVTNAVTSNPITGATITLDPAPVGVSLVTDTTGGFGADIPVGAYTVTVDATDYTTATAPLSVVAGQPATQDFALDPTGEVVVDPGTDIDANPGDPVNLGATVSIFDGTTVTGWAWAQTEGAPVTITDNGDGTASFTLGDLEAFKTALWEHASLPLDPQHGTRDRLGVLPINPLDLEEGETLAFEVTATTSSGDYTAAVDVHVTLPFKRQTGLQNVPIDMPVLLHAPALPTGATGHTWSINSKPTASTATMMDPTSRHGYFTPDVSGEYVIDYNDGGGVQSFSVWGGTWQGGIDGIDANGRPVASACEACHNDGVNSAQLAPDEFNDWRNTGHAEIFTNNYNTSGHWGEACLGCHSVGYDTDAVNGGIDDATGYADFVATLGSPAPTNWSDLVANNATVAKEANIQCENCHGPSGNALHMDGTLGSDPAGWVLDKERISIASEVCAYCHGEPTRHARYQQWQLSGHGNYELATEEATVENRPPSAFFAGAGHCGRCHSGQGFIQWIEKTDLTEMLQDTTRTIPEQTAELAAMGLTEKSVHPQTCVTCHDPHKQGTSSGEPNTATVRIVDATPLLPAGYVAFGVGRGALCIMCHNTRNGTHDETTGTPTSFSAPHVASQADNLLGENAFFVAPGGNRSPHSYIADTCTNCHMEKTPPPAYLSKNLGGTNHTFRASVAICSECHGPGINGLQLQDTTHAGLQNVANVAGQVISNALAAEISIDGAYYVRAYDAATGAYSSSDADVMIDAVPAAVTLTEVHGQIALHLTLDAADAINNPFGAGTVTEVLVQIGSVKNDDPASTPVAIFDTGASSANATLIKALWNYYLIESDGSFGIHNPDFTFDVLGTTFVELSALLP